MGMIEDAMIVFSYTNTIGFLLGVHLLGQAGEPRDVMYVALHSPPLLAHSRHFVPTYHPSTEL